MHLKKPDLERTLRLLDSPGFGFSKGWVQGLIKNVLESWPSEVLQDSPDGLRRERDEARRATEQITKQLSDEIVRLKMELQQLRPPEARFSVGQVVMVERGPYGALPLPYAIKISGRRLVNGTCKYKCSVAGIEHDECNLRGLTHEERQ